MQIIHRQPGKLMKTHFGVSPLQDLNISLSHNIVSLCSWNHSGRITNFHVDQAGSILFRPEVLNSTSIQGTKVTICHLKIPGIFQNG